jgi:hypothetical protein
VDRGDGGSIQVDVEHAQCPPGRTHRLPFSVVPKIYKPLSEKLRKIDFFRVYCTAQVIESIFG